MKTEFVSVATFFKRYFTVSQIFSIKYLFSGGKESVRQEIN